MHDLVVQDKAADAESLAIALHELLKTVAFHIQDRMRVADIGDSSAVEIALSFPNQREGNIRIEYTIKKGYGNSTTGSRLDRAIDEQLRRLGWDERNAPKLLTGAPEMPR